ncbi:MAG TPA: hypothetical protein PKC59_00775 [Burkholderiaceae bacterium]|nr:hypothetical protein [Burkholderiaceae bacterium]HMX09646.1 hypothetical protein [Burkholderiaceae bacterium]HMY98285.1 hypothetical protein [Burkholderiaceae bacterium]HNB42807.1 hypothetical protein [Burkholderiaceae bacterium]HNG78301.1 hypothetical protein [Burkholderiaceae bacterium]
MHFRLATEADLPDCLALLRSAGLTRLSPRVWAGLPELLRRHLRADRQRPKSVMLWEQLQPDGTAILQAFGVSLFVDDATYDALRDGDAPYFAEALCTAWLDDRAGVLSADAIARDNAGGGLNVVAPFYVQRHHDLNHPVSRRLMPLGAAAWFFCHGGYNVRRILWEAYGQPSLGYLLAGGFRHLRSFPAPADGPRDCQPHWCEVTREDHARPAAFNAMAMWAMVPPPPRMHLPLSQQSVVILALQGDTDQRVAARLQISLDAVKQAWRAISAAAAPFVPELHDPPGDGSGLGVRGAERRRVVVEYLRQHMEELRPWPRRARARSATR